MSSADTYVRSLGPNETLVAISPEDALVAETGNWQVGIKQTNNGNLAITIKLPGQHFYVASLDSTWEEGDTLSLILRKDG